MSGEPVRDRAAMIAGMSPALDPGPYVFVTTREADAALRASARAVYAEAEGTSLILPLAVARAQGFDCALPMACITLEVHSALDGVGLTAAVATALADAQIPCNIVAAFHHDHAYVPADRAEEALAILRETARQA